jgi:ABC-type Mn2+/Zn2+ transport system ATPase subunit
VLELSGGELQKVALCLALGKQADVYLIDEPSSFLDSEQRLLAAKVIKRYSILFYFILFYSIIFYFILFYFILLVCCVP